LQLIDLLVEGRGKLVHFPGLGFRGRGASSPRRITPVVLAGRRPPTRERAELSSIWVRCAAVP
jgi:hypothetical protein